MSNSQKLFEQFALRANLLPYRGSQPADGPFWQDGPASMRPAAWRHQDGLVLRPQPGVTLVMEPGKDTCAGSLGFGITYRPGLVSGSTGLRLNFAGATASPGTFNTINIGSHSRPGGKTNPGATPPASGRASPEGGPTTT